MDYQDKKIFICEKCGEDVSYYESYDYRGISDGILHRLCETCGVHIIDSIKVVEDEFFKKTNKTMVLINFQRGEYESNIFRY